MLPSRRLLVLLGSLLVSVGCSSSDDPTQNPGGEVQALPPTTVSIQSRLAQSFDSTTEHMGSVFTAARQSYGMAVVHEQLQAMMNMAADQGLVAERMADDPVELDFTPMVMDAADAAHDFLIGHILNDAQRDEPMDDVAVYTIDKAACGGDFQCQTFLAISRIHVQAHGDDGLTLKLVGKIKAPETLATITMATGTASAQIDVNAVRRLVGQLPEEAQELVDLGDIAGVITATMTGNANKTSLNLAVTQDLNLSMKDMRGETIAVNVAAAEQLLHWSAQAEPAVMTAGIQANSIAVSGPVNRMVWPEDSTLPLAGELLGHGIIDLAGFSITLKANNDDTSPVHLDRVTMGDGLSTIDYTRLGAPASVRLVSAQLVGMPAGAGAFDVHGSASDAVDAPMTIDTFTVAPGMRFTAALNLQSLFEDVGAPLADTVLLNDASYDVALQSLEAEEGEEPVAPQVMVTGDGLKVTEGKLTVSIAHGKEDPVEFAAEAGACVGSAISTFNQTAMPDAVLSATDCH